VKVTFQPGRRTVKVAAGTTLMEAARLAGFSLENQCGALGTCGNCRVLLLKGKADRPTQAEKETLSRRDLAHGIRLACQVKTRGPLMEALVLPSSLVMEQRYQLEGTAAACVPDPGVRSFELEMPLPDLEDIRSDLARLTDSLYEAHGVRLRDAGLAALRGLPGMLRAGEGKVQALVRDGRLLGLRPHGANPRLYGLAVDLGTSKIALILTDLSTGEVVVVVGLMNPQLPFGEDVISRLGYAMEGEDQARRLRDAVVEAINRELGPLCQRAGLSPRDVVEMSLVGNTAMHHLFLGLPVRQLAFSPFVPAVSSAMEVAAQDLGLGILPQASVLFPPPLAGFVGSDHLAALLASRLQRHKGVCLLADLGTNTEIALKTPDGITCCSCASGPAFEGGSLAYGMRAAEGAIEKVDIDGTGGVGFVTVGAAAPRGICGSGVLSALAEMREAGIMDDSGRILEGNAGVAQERGEPVFRIARRASRSGRTGRWISLSQRDVREVQKAKGAVRAGIEMLLDHAGLAQGDIDKVILAGAFGNYLNPADLLDIAMLPPLPVKDIVQVGNAAGVGAREMLVSLKMRREAARLAKEIDYLELATYPRTELYFASSMLLSEDAVQRYMRKWR
jgi:uncharacterized 2Fe-2S/4Fe-4S cluster protein (DUF4445 family)